MSALFQLLKPKPKPKPNGTFAAQVEESVTQLEAMIDSSEDEYVDPRDKDLQLKRMSGGPDYGMDYLGDKEAEAGDDPGAKTGPGGSSSQAETEDCEWDVDLDSPLGGRGD
jgi:hypothetical protein